MPIRDDLIRKLEDEFGPPARTTDKVMIWAVAAGLGLVLQTDAPNGGDEALLWVPHLEDGMPIPEIALVYLAEADRHSNTYVAPGLSSGRPALRLTITSVQELHQSIDYIKSLRDNAQRFGVSTARADSHHDVTTRSNGPGQGTERWSDEELAATVEAYLALKHAGLRGERIIKARTYRTLAARFGRTSKAYEYRMQNISYVLALGGREWVPGLKPMSHVGAEVIGRIEAMFARLEGRAPNLELIFRSQSTQPQTETALPLPAGNKTPRTTTATTTIYERDPGVVRWVLCQARGHCELCGQRAPFDRFDGTPFLEVHHVTPLAEGGADTTENAVAVCPNCHRALHYASDRRQRVADLRGRIPRLAR